MMPPSHLPHPDLFHAMAALGWLELGSSVEARQELALVTDAHRAHPDTLEVWWKIFAEEKNWPDALTAAEKIAATAPERVSGWIDQSYALHELGRTREAATRLAAVVEQFPDHYVIPYNLACYECRLGQREESLRWLRLAVQAADAKTIRALAEGDADLEPLRAEIARLT